MKITLIEPAMIKNKDFGEKPAWMLQPLTLATLAELTPSDVEVQAVDDRLLDLSANFQDAWHLFTYLGMNLPAYREETQRAQQVLRLA